MPLPLVGGSRIQENSSMRIAQIAPLFESCPPQYYGCTERIVSYLTEELVRQGHDVTLFASGDSRTAAYLEPCCKVALRSIGRERSIMAFLMISFRSTPRRRAAISRSWGEFRRRSVRTARLKLPRARARS